MVYLSFVIILIIYYLYNLINGNHLARMLQQYADISVDFFQKESLEKIEKGAKAVTEFSIFSLFVMIMLFIEAAILAQAIMINGMFILKLFMILMFIYYLIKSKPSSVTASINPKSLQEALNLQKYAYNKTVYSIKFGFIQLINLAYFSYLLLTVLSK